MIDKKSSKNSIDSMYFSLVIDLMVEDIFGDDFVGLELSMEGIEDGLDLSEK